MKNYQCPKCGYQFNMFQFMFVNKRVCPKCQSTVIKNNPGQVMFTILLEVMAIMILFPSTSILLPIIISVVTAMITYVLLDPKYARLSIKE